MTIVCFLVYTSWMSFDFKIRWIRVSLKAKRKEYLLHKESARALVHERLKHWNTFYNFTYGRIAIRNQRSRWGSCSKKGNLNFSYKIALLPPNLADYLIVHELCHIGEFNHSNRFWDLVGRAIPDYKALSKDLKGRR
jgi:predicted metal-dependent hydrolase